MGSQIATFALKKMRRFDLYPKFHDEFSVRTGTGGALSLVTFVVLFVMCAFEIGRFSGTTASDRVGVARKQKLIAERVFAPQVQH